MTDNPLGANDPNDELAKVMAEYRAAVEAEFELAEMAKEDPAIVAEKARLEIVKHTGVGIAGIVELARNATAETVKLSACKFLVERSLGKGTADAADDALTKLISQLTANAANE